MVAAVLNLESGPHAPRGCHGVVGHRDGGTRRRQGEDGCVDTQQLEGTLGHMALVWLNGYTGMEGLELRRK